MSIPFQQVNVFSSHPLKGNPVAVVTHAASLDEATMKQLARWTNLSETTFILPPTTPKADYRLRIFTPTGELPFAGHPTLGSCHAWLHAGGQPRSDIIVQECHAGLVSIKRSPSSLSFSAPPLVRSGPLSADLLARIARGLHISENAIVASSWVDNGPGWMGILLRSRQDVLSLTPDYAALSDLSLGVIAPWNSDIDGTAAQFEIRAFAMAHGVPEDPVCGSLNAGIAQWLIAKGKAPSRYTVAQGSAVGRDGKIYIEAVNDTIWVGGQTQTTIAGELALP